MEKMYREHLRTIPLEEFLERYNSLQELMVKIPSEEWSLVIEDFHEVAQSRGIMLETQ